MIVSASYRTDIPAFYADWFLRRLEAGACRVINPYGGQITEVPLTGERVDGFVFWTRNALPFLDALEAVAARSIPFVVQHTVTAYPRALESSVVAPGQAIGTMRALAERFGPRSVVWRYDPVLITSLTPAEWHRRRFRELATSLTAGPAPICDEVILSFAHIYAKTRNNTARAARTHGFDWRDPPAEEKRALLGDLAAIAAEHGLAATLCAQLELLVAGLEPAACIDSHRLSDLAGRPVTAKTKGNRPGCLCAESRDIGAYDSCPHGCVYCYAVRSPAAAKANYRRHNPDSEVLITAAKAGV